jgi:hypothetical protein
MIKVVVSFHSPRRTRRAILTTPSSPHVVAFVQPGGDCRFGVHGVKMRGRGGGIGVTAR